jgi:hypothetical protein
MSNGFMSHLSGPPRPAGTGARKSELTHFSTIRDRRVSLNTYPDVAAAVAERRFVSGHEHFQKHGRQEGRRFRLLQELRSSGQAG